MPLQTILHDAIAEAGGCLPFHRFMQLSLYHPQHGYYMSRRPRLGRTGDFVTAPEMTSLFGELLTVQCMEVWQRLGHPSLFQVVEAGAGSGKLAADICRTARRFPEFHAALRYTILEISPDFREIQRQTLMEAGCSLDTLCWTECLEGGIEGVVLSNEFLDAFPVHWVEMTATGLQEVGVTLEGDVLTPRLLPLSLPLEPACLSRLGVELPVGGQAEVGLAAAAWMAEAARRLQRGVILSIDYGHTRTEYDPSALPQGTLSGYYRHQQINNPLLHPGDMDLTAHVHFTAVAQAGEDNGLTTLGYTTQAWFLMGLGLLHRLERLAHSQSAESFQRLRQTVLRLIMPQGMGDRFKCLAQGKGVEGPPLAGFSLQNSVQRLDLKKRAPLGGK